MVSKNVYFAYVDKCHHDAFQIAYFEANLDVSVSNGVIYLAGNRVDCRDRSFFLYQDGSTRSIEFDIEDYEVTEEFGCGVAGLYGNAPYFKEYEIDIPKTQILEKLANLPKNNSN